MPEAAVSNVWQKVYSPTMSAALNQSKIRSFTDLIAWQEGHKLVLMVYKEVRALPTPERYNLADQMQRAAVSIASNIAEGFVRRS